MSASDPAYMMGDARDDYDLPRWQTHLDPLQLSSSAQAAQQAFYPLNSLPPPPTSASLPPTSPHRINPSVQTPSAPSRQTRVSQLMEQDPHQFPSLSSPTTSSSSSSATAPNRARRHHQPADLEGNYSDQPPLSSQRHLQPSSQNSFYPSTGSYLPQSIPDGPVSAGASPSGPADSFGDMYYHSQKRDQQPGLAPTASRGGGASPLRATMNPNSAAMMDAYGPQQSPYTPTTAPYSPFTSPDQRSLSSSAYQSVNRNQVQVKSEPMATPVLQSMSLSSPGYPMDTTTSTSSHPLAAGHLGVRKNSVSNPGTPMSYLHPSQTPNNYYPQDQPMVVDMPPKQRQSGFRRVRNVHDLQPRLDNQPQGRRIAGDGSVLSPLKQLTTHLVDTYHICNPQFRYESTHNPRRVLTKPSKPVHNDGYDNDDYDYILYVNDWLGAEDGHKYLILDILGQGTFGQVVKCQNMKTHEIVAVKVVKNKPAYFNQSMMEVTILELLNKNCDPNDEHHILRLRDSFIHKSHLCLVFELLSSNLYELIKQNQFQGLSTQLVKVFMAQLLDALTVLKDARLIHCDLKPENILLKSLQSPQIKIIDFGSACHERQTVYTYIQSRFYRSPEVLLGMGYTAAIDMWSLGCIAVELFLGLPLFPGTSEYNQITRIVEMLGMPPLSMLNTGKQTSQFFDSYEAWNPRLNQNEKKYRLKSLEQYSREHNTNEQPGKQYFKATTLPDIVNTAPMPTTKSSRSNHEIEKELNNRASFIDFCKGLLDMNPVTRWTPQQARNHPFITGEKYTKPFVPDGLNSHSSTATDPKRPYGGLVPSQPKGVRAYQDAASYNQHLTQHQVYTAQASQAANTLRNPYMTQQQPAVPPSTQSTSYSSGTEVSPPYPQSQTYIPPAATGTHRLTHQNSHGQLNAGNSMSQYPNQSQGNSSSHLTPGMAASNTYYHNNQQRGRSNTVNQQLDAIPPALARLQHMNQDVIAGRNALTPVLNRDDAMREWERRQSGKVTAAQPYPQLEYLQQQAEMAGTGMTNWVGNSNRYQQQPSKLSNSYNPHPMDEDDDGRRDAVMSNVRSAARNDGSSGMYGSSSVASNPAQAYTTPTTSGSRFPGGFPQQQINNSFDALDPTRRTDIGNLFVPLQPDQYGSFNSPAMSTSQRHMAPSQSIASSFYAAGVVPSGQQNTVRQHPNPFDGPQQPASGNSVKDARRGSGVDAWSPR